METLVEVVKQPLPEVVELSGNTFRLVPYCQTNSAPDRVWIEHLVNGVWIPRRKRGIWDTRSAAIAALRCERCGAAS